VTRINTAIPSSTFYRNRILPPKLVFTSSAAALHVVAVSEQIVLHVTGNISYNFAKKKLFVFVFCQVECLNV